MTRPLSIPLSPGLPDAGATGQWLGRDRRGAVYTLRWMPEKQCWGALGWRATHPRPWPELVLLQGEQEGFIVGHVEGPAIEPGLAYREGFLSAALADLIRDDRNTGRAIATADTTGITTIAGRLRSPSGPGSDTPAWSPWFWTVAMLFGLPALALALVFLAAHAPNAGGKPTAPGQSQERNHG